MKNFLKAQTLGKNCKGSWKTPMLMGLFLTGILTACVTTKAVRQSYCKNIDTYKLGRLDVSKGKTVESFHRTSKKCVRYGVELNQREYEKGRKEELQTFCSYEKGYEFGESGKKYWKICPERSEREFLKGYKKGDKKCLYEAGYSDAVSGRTSSAFSYVKCLKLSVEESQKEYERGRTSGLKVFCSYEKGYEFGESGKKYLGICPERSEREFLKGYKKGDKKCLYEAGYSDAVSGWTSSAFSYVKCLKLSVEESQKEYERGRTSGLKVFCSYKKGYSLGLKNVKYYNICPKELEPDFFKGYTLGLQEYKSDQRQEKMLAIEQQKMAIERNRTQQLLAIEREKVAVEQERLREEQSAREEFFKLQHLRGRQLCRVNSDCHRGGICRYHFRLRDYVCQYNALKSRKSRAWQLCRVNSDCHRGGVCRYHSRLRNYICRY